MLGGNRRMHICPCEVINSTRTKFGFIAIMYPSVLWVSIHL